MESSCLPLKSQQTGQVGGKEHLLYFRCWQLGGGGGRHLSKGQLHPKKQAVRAFIDRVGGRVHAETAQLSLTIIFKLVISGLISTILIVLGTVNLHFQGPFVPIPLQSILRIVAAHVLGTIWSSHS